MDASRSLPNTDGPRRRARDAGITIGRIAPGQLNAITDVPGVEVGHATIVAGEGPLVVGKGPVRTGVTVVIPRRTIASEPVFAGYHVLNGNGEMTGLLWVEESGLLTTPIGITNTHSVGIVRDAIIAAEAGRFRNSEEFAFSLPVVAETYDGYLSDINGMHVTAAHVFQALEDAKGGPVAEGCVGGGTGMICHGFKGGIGTASRTLLAEQGGWTVGALVQANYGQRALLRIDGVPIGRMLDHTQIPEPDRAPPAGTGSIIVILATDAPLLPTGCRRLAQRATLGIARMGGLGENSSGDLFLAFSTANSGLGSNSPQDRVRHVSMLAAEAMSPLFEAAGEATEEAILNALCAATTTTGINGRVVHAMDVGRVAEIMRRYQEPGG